MSKDFSAAASQKTASVAKPFDRIMELENAETARVERELKAMEREKVDILKKTRETEEAAEKKAREEAKAELKKFKEKGMQEHLEQGRKKAADTCKALEDRYKKEAPAIIADLVEKATASDSPLLV